MVASRGPGWQRRQGAGGFGSVPKSPQGPLPAKGRGQGRGGGDVAQAPIGRGPEREGEGGNGGAPSPSPFAARRCRRVRPAPRYALPRLPNESRAFVLAGRADWEAVLMVVIRAGGGRRELG